MFKITEAAKELMRYFYENHDQTLETFVDYEVYKKATQTTLLEDEFVQCIYYLIEDGMVRNLDESISNNPNSPRQFSLKVRPILFRAVENQKN